MAKELGVRHLAMPTNGNAGAALAAYGSRAGMRTTVFCPEDTPEINVREIAAQGARIFRVNGLIDQCGKLVAAGRDTVGWFDVSTLNEPLASRERRRWDLSSLSSWIGSFPPRTFIPPAGARV
jgi:threonine synthase